MIRRLARVLALAALAAAVLPGCDPPAAPLTPQTDGNFPQARRFDTRGAAEVRIENLRLPGTFEMRYFMLPGDRVLITEITGELEDQVIRRKRIFGPDVRIPMFCNQASLVKSDAGTVTGGSALEFPANALEIQGMTFNRRGVSDTCPAPDGALALSGRNRAGTTGLHEPAAGRFELVSPLALELGGEDRRGAMTLQGRYTNRPPVARIGSRADGLYDFSAGGCPPVRGQSGAEPGTFTWPDPPEISGNRPEGLEVVFRSVSTDPDGEGAPTTGNDDPRVDLATEQWAHWRGTEYRSLGRGWELPPIVFEKGVLHRVLLTATDRSGARSQAECRFVVTD